MRLCLYACNQPETENFRQAVVTRKTTLRLVPGFNYLCLAKNRLVHKNAMVKTINNKVVNDIKLHRIRYNINQFFVFSQKSTAE